MESPQLNHEFSPIYGDNRHYSARADLRSKSTGTGIFVTPTTVIHYTHSVGITMLLWVCGSIAAIAGTLVYIEFGLTTPRYLFGREKKSVPRNGGELHYVRPSNYSNLFPRL